MKSSFLIISSAIVLAACVADSVADAPKAQSVESVSADLPTSHLSGKVFITQDLEESIAFYTQVLGYKIVRRRQIDSEATASVIGVAPGTVIDYVNLVPAEFSETAPYFPGLNLVGLPEARPSAFPQVADRAPQFSELVMAFEVSNLDVIVDRAECMGLQIVTPLALSSTGKSRTLTVLDPNGIRVQMYEYVQSARSE